MTSPITANFGCSYQYRFVSNPSVTAATRSSPTTRTALTPSAARRSVACAHAASRVAGVDASSATSTWRVWRFPASICSVQWRCIAASRSGCGPSTVRATGPASRRTRTSSCIGFCNVWHIRANDAAAAALRAGSSASMSRSLVASTADTWPPCSQWSCRMTTDEMSAGEAERRGSCSEVRTATGCAIRSRRGGRDGATRSPPAPTPRDPQAGACSPR